MGAADSGVLLGGLLLTRRGVINVLAVGRTACGAHCLDRQLRVPLAAGKARLLQITRMIASVRRKVISAASRMCDLQHSPL